MKEWHSKYNSFYDVWWEENKDQIIPFGLENLSPEVKASHTEEELIMSIKEMYREWVIDRYFWLKNYTETHKGDLDEHSKERINKFCEMVFKEL